MMNRRIFVLLATLAFSCAPLHARKRVVAYLPNHTGLGQFSKTIDYDKLTHINLAFENPSDDGGELTCNPANSELVRRAHAAQVKVLVSIGGGGAAGNQALKARYFALLAADRRKDFVAKLATYAVQHDFDGIDVDLEGSLINRDYGAFIADLTAAMKAKGKLVTAALAQGNGGDRVPDSVLRDLDFLNIMAYDATGPWNPDRHGQHSSLEFAQNAVKYWTGRGLPKDKAVLGVPFYGYGFGPAFRKEGYTYAQLLELYPDAVRHDQVGETIWHNSIPTMRAKAEYVVRENLGGIMIWALNQDVKGENSLLNAVHDTLNSKVAPGSVPQS